LRERRDRDSASSRCDQIEPSPACNRTGGRRFSIRVDSWISRYSRGEYYVTGKADEVLITVLGSCVSAAFGTPLSASAKNHFMLPAESFRQVGRDRNRRVRKFRHGELINELIKAAHGVNEMEIKVFRGRQRHRQLAGDSSQN